LGGEGILRILSLIQGVDIHAIADFFKVGNDFDAAGKCAHWIFTEWELIK